MCLFSNWNSQKDGGKDASPGVYSSHLCAHCWSHVKLVKDWEAKLFI